MKGLKIYERDNNKQDIRGQKLILNGYNTVIIYKRQKWALKNL